MHTDDHLVSCFLRYQNQARILHWQTKKYGRHNAYGMLYDGLSGLIDSFVEAHMGKYGRVTINQPIELKNMDELSVGDFMEEMSNYLLSLNKMYDTTRDSDLLNIRDEMLGLVNKIKYLLTLD